MSGHVGVPPEWQSWTRRTWILVWVSVLLPVLVAGTWGILYVSRDEDGSALEGANLQSNGITSLEAHLGHEYWLTFPMMKNTTGDTIEIEKFEIQKVSRWLRVLGFTTVNVDAGDLHGDVPLAWDTSELIAPVPPGTDLRQRQYRTKMPYSIKAHRVSPTAGVVRVMLMDDRAALRATETSDVGVSGCQVTYKQGGDVVSQTLKCQFFIGSHFLKSSR